MTPSQMAAVLGLDEVATVRAVPWSPPDGSEPPAEAAVPAVSRIRRLR